ncbi:MAG: haloalkane dehalogenase [Gammaproteobacteria bacterium]|nr:haloalkane dehalogenase [Gammaproteobacteria bacterium]
MLSERITSNFPYESHYVDIHGAKLHYIEEGIGDPILLLHGMPTSSYLWRNIIPHLVSLGRCIAVDLVGMGKSDKPNIEYTIEDHINYIEKFIETLNLKNVTFIMHGWGSIIGMHYAMRHQKNCKGIVFYEAYLQPLNNENVSLPYQELLYDLQENSFDIVANGARFIDQFLPQMVLRTLSQEEMQNYREPFLSPGTGKPLEQYVKEILPNNNKKIDQIISDYSQQLMKSSLPKLMLYSVPGFITTIATVIWAKEHLTNLEIVDIGEALHCAQETNPDVMGETISIWLQGIEQLNVIE